MNLRQVFATAALAIVLASAHARAGTAVAAANPAQPPAQSKDHSNEVSLDGYRTHLQTLTTLVELCAKARDMKNCDPTLVGSDDHVPLSAAPNAERRLVRYGWLRVLFSKAQDKDKPQPKPKPALGAQGAPQDDSANVPTPTTSQLLMDAETRLAHDLAQADAAAGALPAHNQERAAMSQILSGRDFRDLEEPTARDSALEKFGNWLNRLFEGAAQFGARSAWIARLLVGGFVVVVCAGLVWGLLQLERRWRIRLVPEDRSPAPGAASARDWQLWLDDARKSAAAGLWREAIHFVYWASISRLESRRLWPADRARTPREYLALVGPDDPRKPSLATLTRSFERTWYGGRAAAESDYRNAEQLATTLISGNAAPAPGVRGGGAG